MAAAYGAYVDAVSAQQPALAAISDDVHARTTIDLLIVADGSLR